MVDTFSFASLQATFLGVLEARREQLLNAPVEPATIDPTPGERPATILPFSPRMISSVPSTDPDQDEALDDLLKRGIQPFGGLGPAEHFVMTHDHGSVLGNIFRPPEEMDALCRMVTEQFRACWGDDVVDRALSGFRKLPEDTADILYKRLYKQGYAARLFASYGLDAPGVSDDELSEALQFQSEVSYVRGAWRDFLRIGPVLVHPDHEGELVPDFLSLGLAPEELGALHATVWEGINPVDKIILARKMVGLKLSRGAEWDSPSRRRRHDWAGPGEPRFLVQLDRRLNKGLNREESGNLVIEPDLATLGLRVFLNQDDHRLTQSAERGALLAGDADSFMIGDRAFIRSDRRYRTQAFKVISVNRDQGTAQIASESASFEIPLHRLARQKDS